MFNGEAKGVRNPMSPSFAFRLLSPEQLTFEKSLVVLLSSSVFLYEQMILEGVRVWKSPVETAMQLPQTFIESPRSLEGELPFQGRDSGQ